MTSKSLKQNGIALDPIILIVVGALLRLAVGIALVEYRRLRSKDTADRK